MSRQPNDREGYDCAIARVYEQYHKPLFSFILRSVGRRETAEDILQEVFLRLVRQEHLLSDARDPRAWLYRVAATRVIDHFRSRPAQSEMPVEPQTLECLPAHQESPDAMAVGGETTRIVRKALGRLSHNERMAIMMRQYSGMPFAEVAKAMGAPLSTVLSWVHRGLEKLGKDLREQGFKADDLLRG